MLHAHIKYGPTAGGRGQYENAFQSPTFEREVTVKVNEPVGSATISPCGRDIALASNEGLHIVDLDNIYSPPRLVKHFTTGDVADVQWSPFASRDSWLISTTNQKALVWNLNMRQSPAPIEYVLHGHSRAITDINFSAHHPDLLATCSVDSSVACWDLRDAGRPHMKFSYFQAGATQVKWNRQDCNVVASAHHSKLIIWDCRRGNEPLWSADAHDTKIYGIDWHRTRSSAILTCSLDRTIKLWDFAITDAEGEHLERIIRTPFPVWRARHTPFGWGILAMPQRDSNDLFMYDRRQNECQSVVGEVDPVCNFTGHHDSVKEFLWRSRGDVTDDGIDDRDFQLVSWGRDRLLKLHRIKKENLQSVGYEKGKAALHEYNFTRKGAAYRSFTEFPVNEEDFSTSESLQPVQISGHRESALTNLIKGETQQKTTHAPIVPYPQGYGSGMSYSGPSKVKSRREESVISWMKNVSLAPRDWESTEADQDLFNGIDPGRVGRKYDDPEDLGDEITQVGDQFKKITFEDANVSRRYAIIFLYGPWGENTEICPMRITINFPRQYPKKVPPRFNIDETSNVKKETAKRLVQDLDEISEFHSQRSNGCLEYVIMYLLGERSKNDCTNQSDMISKLPSADEDSSSDEGDESGIIGGLHGVEASGTDIISKANVNVPMATTCTVKWSNDGQLICVFMVSHETVDEQSSHFSEILHKYARSSIGRMSRAYGLARASSSSSESSSSEDPEATSSEPFAGWLPGRLRLHPSRSAESSQHASGAVLKPKQHEQIEKESRIQRLDMTGNLPPLKALAQRWSIFGTGGEVCTHNADIAAALGYKDHADVWSLLATLLEDSVPLQSVSVLKASSATEDVLVVARRTLVQIRRNAGTNMPDGECDLDFDEPDAVVRPKYRSRVKWGNHPFAATWLIPKLFDYFEAQSDVLMLGMMATVLAQPNNKASHIRPFIEAAPGYFLNYAPSAETSMDFAGATEIPSAEYLLERQRPDIYRDSLKNMSKLMTRSRCGVESLPSTPPTPASSEEDNVATGRPHMYIELKNQDRFESEGHYDAPLLSSPGLAERCHIYRSRCAHLLRSLSQWSLAAEMEKISQLELEGMAIGELQIPLDEAYDGMRVRRKRNAEKGTSNVERCGFCRERIMRDLCATCTICGAAMHSDCVMVNGGKCVGCTELELRVFD